MTETERPNCWVQKYCLATVLKLFDKNMTHHNINDNYRFFNINVIRIHELSEFDNKDQRFEFYSEVEVS